MTGCLPILLQMKGGGGHLTAIEKRLRLQPESCRLADSESDSESQGVGRLDSRSGMDQPEFWTQLKREKSSQLDRVEPSKLTRYHQGIWKVALL